jgi:hypothetical protein
MSKSKIAFPAVPSRNGEEKAEEQRYGDRETRDDTSKAWRRDTLSLDLEITLRHREFRTETLGILKLTKRTTTDMTPVTSPSHSFVVRVVANTF